MNSVVSRTPGTTCELRSPKASDFHLFSWDVSGDNDEKNLDRQLEGSEEETFVHSAVEVAQESTSDNDQARQVFLHHLYVQSDQDGEERVNIGLETILEEVCGYPSPTLSENEFEEMESRYGSGYWTSESDGESDRVTVVEMDVVFRTTNGREDNDSHDEMSDLECEISRKQELSSLDNDEEEYVFSSVDSVNLYLDKDIQKAIEIRTDYSLPVNIDCRFMNNIFDSGETVLKTNQAVDCNRGSDWPIFRTDDVINRSLSLSPDDINKEGCHGNAAAQNLLNGTAEKEEVFLNESGNVAFVSHEKAAGDSCLLSEPPHLASLVLTSSRDGVILKDLTLLTMEGRIEEDKMGDVGEKEFRETSANEKHPTDVSPQVCYNESVARTTTGAYVERILEEDKTPPGDMENRMDLTPAEHLKTEEICSDISSDEALLVTIDSRLQRLLERSSERITRTAGLLLSLPVAEIDFEAVRIDEKQERNKSDDDSSNIQVKGGCGERKLPSKNFLSEAETLDCERENLIDDSETLQFAGELFLDEQQTRVAPSVDELEKKKNAKTTNESENSVNKTHREIVLDQQQRSRQEAPPSGKVENNQSLILASERYSLDSPLLVTLTADRVTPTTDEHPSPFLGLPPPPKRGEEWGRKKEDLKLAGIGTTSLAGGAWGEENVGEDANGITQTDEESLRNTDSPSPLQKQNKLLATTCVVDRQHALPSVNNNRRRDDDDDGLAPKTSESELKLASARVSDSLQDNPLSLFTPAADQDTFIASADNSRDHLTSNVNYKAAGDSFRDITLVIPSASCTLSDSNLCALKETFEEGLIPGRRLKRSCSDPFLCRGEHFKNFELGYSNINSGGGGSSNYLGKVYEDSRGRILQEDLEFVSRTADSLSLEIVTIDKNLKKKSNYEVFSSLRLANRQMEVQRMNNRTTTNSTGEIISVQVRELEIWPTSPSSPFLARTCETLQLSPPSRPPRKRNPSGTPEGRHPILRSSLSRSPLTYSPPPSPTLTSDTTTGNARRQSPTPYEAKVKTKQEPVKMVRLPEKPVTYEKQKPAIVTFQKKEEFNWSRTFPTPTELRLNGGPPRSRPFLTSTLSPVTPSHPEELLERITGYKTASQFSSSDAISKLDYNQSAFSSKIGKPPLPPLPPSRISNSGVKGRVANARRQYFEKINAAASKAQSAANENPSLIVENRLRQFCAETQRERIRLAQSTPDVTADVEDALRRSRPIDRAPARPAQVDGNNIPETPPPSSYRRRQCAAEIAWPRKQREGHSKDPERDIRRRSRSLGFLETDIDTLESRQVLETDLDAAVASVALEIADLLNHTERFERASSMMLLGDAKRAGGGGGTARNGVEQNSGVAPEDRAKSMDFLLDDDNRAIALPPENSLRQLQADNNKNGKARSEHELRVERSLQNLTLPEWFNKKPREGFLLKRESGNVAKRWDGFRTPSCNSLTSTDAAAPIQTGSASGRSVVIPKRVARPDWRYVGSLRSSRDSIPSSAESASPRDVGTFQYGVSAASDPLSRWSSSRLSTSSTPANSSWSLYRSYRQPYLGWRHASSAASTGGQTPLSSRSTAPSPAPSTPLSGSRPVSPGRGLSESTAPLPPPWLFPKYWMPGENPTPQQDSNEPDSSAIPVPPSRRRLKSQDQSGDDLSPEDLKHDPGNLRHGFYDSENASANKMTRDRYSYTQSIYNSDPKLERGTQVKTTCSSPGTEEDSVATDGSLKSPLSSSSASPQVFWMESSFVGSRTTSVVLLPGGDDDLCPGGSPVENGHAAAQRSPSTNCGELSRSSTSERLGEYDARMFCRYGITL